MAKGMVLRLMVITIIVLLSNMSLGTDATVYQVGGVSGGINWRCCDIDYQAWADTITFLPGDVVVFRYQRSASNVAIVSKQDYNSCSTASIPPAEIFRGSSLRVTLLAEPVIKYIMTTGTNCDKQRFTITMPSNSPPPSASPLPPAQSPSVPSPPAQSPSVPSPSAQSPSVPSPTNDGSNSNASPSSDTTSNPSTDSNSNPSKDAPNSKHDRKSKSSSRKYKIIGGVVGGAVGITITVGISIKLYFVFGKRSRKKKQQSGAAAAAGRKSRAKTTNKDDSKATGVDQE